MRMTATALALILPAAAMAQETTVGTLSGTIDGRQISYAVMDGDDMATGWRNVEEGIEVTLEAYPSDSPVSDETRLLLTFTGEPASRFPQSTDAEVELIDGGTILTGTADSVDLSLGSLEIQGESLLMLGNIRATVAEDGEDATVLAEAGRTLSADIQATVVRADPGGEAAPDAAGSPNGSEAGMSGASQPN